jgi:hypothetical protein
MWNVAWQAVARGDDVRSYNLCDMFSHKPSSAAQPVPLETRHATRWSGKVNKVSCMQRSS